MAESPSCEHLDRLVDVLVEEPWTQSENFKCRDCGYRGNNLWMCLLGDCLHIGCSENHKDHSTIHFKEIIKHCVHMNLSTKRVWCYICNREVFRKAALANAIKNETLTSDQFNSSASSGGLKGAGERVRSNSLLGLERGPVLNVSSVNDSQESSDGEDSFSSLGDDKPRGLVGLQNIGNTCYMNSAIQALSNTPPLTQYFLDCGGAVDFLTDSKKPGLSRSYQKLVQDIWNKRTRDYVVPNSILYGIRNVHPMFRGYHQHDTQEFLRCFMDQLHEELKEPVKDHQPLVEPPTLGYINRQPKLAGVNDVCDSTRDTYMTRQSSTRSADNIPLTKEHYREHSQSDTNFGVKKMISGHRRSNSYCPLPQDVTKDETMLLEKQSSIENETEGEDEEENYETCDSGVSDSADMSGEESHYGRKSEQEDQRVNSSIDSSPNSPPSEQGSGDRSSSLRFRSVISDVFDGKLLSSVQCLTCDRISTRVETFQDLSLPIPSRDHMAVLHGGGTSSGSNSPSPSPGRGAACSDAVYSATQGQEGWVWWILSWLRSWLYGPAVTLHDCLAAFFSADELKGDNMYSCEKCNKLRNGIKYSKVLGLPEVLCVHLKRFRHELMFSTKIGSKVSFPLTGLDMKPYIHKDCKSAVTVYDLAAVICHAGTAGGGHYTCVARNCYSGKWFQFDDQYVSGYTPQQVANCEAYVLFYIKSNPKMISLRQRAIELLETTNELNDIKFYISKQWINRFNTYAEPGPIDNGDFLCEHGGVVPDRIGIVERLTMKISQPLWEFFYKNFGGGPACNQLHACATCHAAAERLKRRQNLELQSFTAYNNITDQKAIFAISMNWFRLWQAFVHNKTQQPPAPIDNSSIVIKSPTLENVAARTTSPKAVVIKAGSDYAQINEDCWRLFHGIYGGGPEVKLKSAPTYQKQNSSVHTISCNSTGYSSGSESYNSGTNFNSVHKSRNSVSFSANYEQLLNKQSDSEDGMEQTTTTKSLSNTDLFNVASRNGEIFGNVKGTQSLQDVSVNNNTFLDREQMIDAKRMSVDSDVSIESDVPKRHPLFKTQNVGNGKNSNKKNAAQKNTNSSNRQGGKQKGSKSIRKRASKGSDNMKNHNSSCEDPMIGDNCTIDLNNKDETTMDVSSPYKKEPIVNHNHINDKNDYMAYEESSLEVEQPVKITPKPGRSKLRKLSTDIHSVCSSMQAVEMSDGDNKPNAESSVLTNSFNKHSNRE